MAGSVIELMDDMHLSSENYFKDYYNAVSDKNISQADIIISENPNIQNQITDSDNINNLIKLVNGNEKQIKIDVDDYLEDQLEAFQQLINQTKVMGEFNQKVKYDIHNLVYYQDKGYYAYKEPPLGTKPTDKNYWLEYDIKGLQGYGGVNLNYRFDWNKDTQYQVLDAVVYQNKLWFANQPNQGIAPSLSHYPWLPAMLPLMPTKTQIRKEEPTVVMSEGDFWFEIIKGNDISQTKWTDMASQIYARYAGALFVFGNEIHTVGGDNIQDEKQVNHQVYDTLTNTWSEKADLPLGISGMASFSIGNKGYITGGVDNKLETIANTYIYDNDTNTWSVGANLPLPLQPLMTGVTGRGKNFLDISNLVTQTTKGVNITKNNDGSITMKGTSTEAITLRTQLPEDITLGAGETWTLSTQNSITDNIEAFSLRDTTGANIVSVASTQKSNSITPTSNTVARYFQIYIQSGKTIDLTLFPQLAKGTDTTYEPHEIGYFMGGLTSTGLPSNVIFKYNYVTNTWSKLADCPDYLAYPSVQYYNGKIYTNGGINYTGLPCDLTYIYDIDTDTWGVGSPSGLQRMTAASFQKDGKIYVCGGANLNGYSIANVLIYDINTNQWKNEIPLQHSRGSAQGTTVGNYGYVIGGINLANDFGVWGYNERYTIS